MTVRSHLLLALPFLLLFPLSVLKWRADARREWQAEHPTLTKTDKVLRAQLGIAARQTSAQICLMGAGPRWQKLTGTADGLILNRDRATFQEIGEALRCDGTLQPAGKGAPQDALMLAIDYKSTNGTRQSIETYYYIRTLKGTYLLNTWTILSNRGWRIAPHFAPRFEALVTRWMQRARTDKRSRYEFKRLTSK